MTTVDEYKAAMNELAAASKDFQPIASFMTKLKDAAGYSPTNWLQANFGLQAQSHGDINRYRMNMKEWPDGESVAAAATRLAKAFNAVHATYKALPEEDREYVKSPPHYPDLK